MYFNPLVSIIIPVYNGKHYMQEAIDSVISQTYKNVEVIVVNDGSTDNTDEIARSYGDKIRYFKNENGGVATALNFGINNMRGEYFSWLSHDDVYYENKIEKQIEELNKLDNKTTILYSNYQLIDELSHILDETNYSKFFPIYKLHYPLFPLLNGTINGCTLLIPKICFEQIGLFDTKLKTSQDYDLWYKMFPYYKIRFMEEALIKSRIHDSQGSKTVSAKKESDTLWISMVNELSEENMILFEGSVLKFYKKTAEIMKKQNYKDAYKYLCKKIDKCKNGKKNISDIKVSVIYPFYNGIKYIEDAVNNLINQTHSNWELLLIDDYSTENIKSITYYTDNDKRIKLLQNKYNKGVFGARNTGIDNAKGDYIVFLGSQDLFLSQKLEKQLNFMVHNHSIVSHTSYETFSKSGERRVFNVGKEDIVFPNIMTNYPIETATVMLNRKILSNHNFRFIEEYSYWSDSYFWISISKIYSIDGIDKVLTKVYKDYNLTVDNNYICMKKLSNIFSFLILEENINYYTKYLDNFFKYLDFKLLTKIDVFNTIIRHENKFNKTKNIFDIKIFKIEKNHKFFILTIFFFIRISIKISKVVESIPTKKLRDNFIDKFV